MAEGRERKLPEVPPEFRWIIRVFTRIDDLVDYFVKVQKSQLEILEEIRKRLPLAPPEIVVPPARPPVLPTIGLIEIGKDSMDALAQKTAALLIRLPNRLDRIEIDTSTDKWQSLRKTGKIKPKVALGFEVENVGGGFEYKILRKGKGPTKSRTALTGDKWDLEFDDINVKGSGDAGIAVINYWWRE